MKPTSGDNQNETQADWPRVLKIASNDEFQQSFAVAQLALKLWEAVKTSNVKSIEKASPTAFLADAWELIERAREQVLRPQSNAEHLEEHQGSKRAGENVIDRIFSESLVPFTKLCDPNRNKDDSETIHEVIWRVYRSKRAFGDLFCAYWHDIGEKWKNPKQAEEQGKLRVDGNSVQMYSEEERQQLAKLARDADAWKQRGKQKLAEWKRHGVPANDFLALARFRTERDNRFENLKRKPRRQLKVR
jgi:hypothetical protein